MATSPMYYSLYTPLPALTLLLPDTQGKCTIIKPRDAAEPRHLEISRSAQSGFGNPTIWPGDNCVLPARFSELWRVVSYPNWYTLVCFAYFSSRLDASDIHDVVPRWR